MTLLVDIVIATGFVAACFLTALILFGLGCDVQRWRQERRAMDSGTRQYLDALHPMCRCTEVPVDQWGDLIDQATDWSPFDDRRAA